MEGFFYPNLIVERQSYEKIFSKSDNLGSGPNVCGANADWGRQIQPLSFEQTKEKPPYGRVYFVVWSRRGHRDPKVQRNLLFENCVNVL